MFNGPRFLWSSAFLLFLVVLSLSVRIDIPVEQLKTKYTDGASKFIPVMGMQVHYRDEGPVTDSIPLVLIHGTSSSLHTWDKLVSKISAQRRVIRFDLPAFGLTGPSPENTYSFTFYNGFLDSLLSKMKIQQCIIAGNSLGGSIAWNYAVHDSNRLNGLILLDAGGYPKKDEKGSLGFKYQVQVNWIQNGDELFGVWNISSSAEKKSDAHKICMAAINSGFDNLYNTHKNWWKEFWSRSSVTLPEKDLEKQYYQEIYKLGSTARKDAPPISLQAIWTADNGKLPPWKGDFHHDLNTQLSYWPAYTSNHLDLSETFTDWLWKVRAENKKYTKAFFQVPGLNVPGVTTISGKPMGGWIQYSFSPSVSCWLAQHFYWQWKYSGSQTFLTNQAYPYLKEVATFIENITIVKDGKRNLLLSSSPEYFDNSIKAWFLNFTNYDLSLMRNALSMTIEAAQKLNYKTEAAHWNEVLSTLPELDINETGLTIAPGQNLDESHRHIAQLMALHPLGTLNPDTEANKMIIENSLRRLEQMGTDWWTGYSFSWAACLYARAGKGEEAVRQLNIFQKNFCLPNTFHANGDQHGGQYSKFTYRPFTLEGNLAYAQGIHELLIQSHQGYIKLFPAIPEAWNNLSFENLRTEGAFLVSAEMKDGKIIRIKIESTTNAELNIILPSIMINSANQKTITGKYSRFMRAGEILLFEDF